MFNQTYYSNSELAPWDTEFNAQWSNLVRSGTINNQVLNQIKNDWETQKLNFIQQAKTKYQAFGGYNLQIIQNAVSKFLMRAVSEYTRPVTPSMAYNPMMSINPAMSGMYGTTPMMAPNPGMMVSPGYNSMMPLSSPITTPQQPTQASIYGQIPDLTPNPNTVQTTAQTPVQQATNEQQPTLVITKKTAEAFNPPTIDDADQLYGSDEHNVSIGKFKVINMLDSDGCKFKHITIQLYDPCVSSEEALLRARKLIPFNGEVHVDIYYDMIRKVNIRYTDLQRVFKAIKQSINLSTKAKNKLKYVQNIIKILNDESRGVYNAIEELFMNAFMQEAKYGLLDSDYPENKSFGCSNLLDLWQLTDKETSNQIIKQWQNRPGFNDRLIEIVDNTIKHLVSDTKIMDPSNQREFLEILKMHHGLTETDEGTLVDVTKELFDKRELFVKATPEQRSKDFGDAGKIISNDSVIVTKNHHLIYTTIILPGSLGSHENKMMVFTGKYFVGGFDKDNNPNKCDTLFEYLITQVSMTDNKSADIIIDYENAIAIYRCILSTDRWHVLVPKLML